MQIRWPLTVDKNYSEYWKINVKLLQTGRDVGINHGRHRSDSERWPTAEADNARTIPITVTDKRINAWRKDEDWYLPFFLPLFFSLFTSLVTEQCTCKVICILFFWTISHWLILVYQRYFFALAGFFSNHCYLKFCSCIRDLQRWPSHSNFSPME